MDRKFIRRAWFLFNLLNDSLLSVNLTSHLHSIRQETLYNIFKLFDIDGNESLKQDQWIENIKGRLVWANLVASQVYDSIANVIYFRDERQIDFAEQLESVAYVISGENAITFDTFVQIWNAKGVSQRNMIY